MENLNNAPVNKLAEEDVNLGESPIISESLKKFSLTLEEFELLNGEEVVKSVENNPTKKERIANVINKIQKMAQTLKYVWEEATEDPIVVGAVLTLSGIANAGGLALSSPDGWYKVAGPIITIGLFVSGGIGIARGVIKDNTKLQTSM